MSDNLDPNGRLTEEEMDEFYSAPQYSITDPEKIRRIAIGMIGGHRALGDKIHEDYRHHGLYPEVLRQYNITPEKVVYRTGEEVRVNLNTPNNPRWRRAIVRHQYDGSVGVDIKTTGADKLIPLSHIRKLDAPHAMVVDVPNVGGVGYTRFEGLSAQQASSLTTLVHFVEDITKARNENQTIRKVEKKRSLYQILKHTYNARNSR